MSFEDGLNCLDAIASDAEGRGVNFLVARTVDEDGKIEVPFFDKPVVAKCRSERELRADISALLKGVAPGR